MRSLPVVQTRRLLRSAVCPLAAECWRAAPSRLFCSSLAGEAERRPSMLRHLTSKIKATGPISVAEYMREVLTNPVTGYYVRKNMLGPDGDFITSPEISQVFGELIGVWIISEWMAAGRPKQLQLVELGPGRGSLAADVLRVLAQLQSVLSGASVSLHLVEVSPALCQLQAQTLIGGCSQEADTTKQSVYRHGETSSGLPVSWYHSLDDVPPGFSVFTAHEFFDALPIHKFQMTEKGWREVMVDIDPEKPEHLRFVVSPSPTLASSTLLHDSEKREHVEVCAEGGVIVQQLARRIVEDGGAALIADYGHDGTKMDTFRIQFNLTTPTQQMDTPLPTHAGWCGGGACTGHQLHDVLTSPGSADLTADVDFSYLRRLAGGAVASLGPVPQRTFLKNMGIEMRMQVLLSNCSDPSTRRQLISSYDMLTNPNHMGERFHFFSLLHHSRLAQPAAHKGLKLEKNQSPAPLPVAGFTKLSFS